MLGGKSRFGDIGVYFLGNLGIEKRQIIESATVGVVNPSGLTENCPMSVVEFYQSGIPVVSSPKYGMRDMIIAGQTGILCRSSSQLSKSLIKFLNGSHNSETLGRNGMEFAKKRFTPEVIVEDWMKIFEGEFTSSVCREGYWAHKVFSFFKHYHLLPVSFPMVEDQKIYLARLRVKFSKFLR